MTSYCITYVVIHKHRLNAITPIFAPGSSNGFVHRVIEELRAEVYCIQAPESPRKSPRKGVTVDTRTYSDILEVQEPEGAGAQFSRQRALPLAHNDAIRPISEIEAESHENYYRLLDKVDIESIAPIKQDWIYNVCGMANVDSYSIPKVCFRHQIE